MLSSPSLAPAAVLSALLAALAACAEAEPAVGAFERTGELVALSGGDAGARGACITCHGLHGEGDGNLVPRLAGLDPGYVARQLESFAEGQRHHPQMAWIAGRLDWPARQRVAAYFSAMEPSAVEPAGPRNGSACEPSAARLYHSGDPGRGIEACAACHGDDGLGTGRGNPPLAGQPAPYLARQIERWRGGERYGDPLGTMRHISRLLAEREIEPLARYSSRPLGSMWSRALREACPRARRSAPRSDA